MSDAVESVDVQPVSPQPTPAAPKKTVSRRGRRLLLAIIIVLLLALAGISTLLMSYVLPKGNIAKGEQAGGLTWVRSIYGWGSTPETQFKLPRELNITSNGTIWVTDGAYKEALAFNPEGKLINSVGKAAKERIVGLGPISSGPDESIFVGEPEMDRIRVFEADGKDEGYIPFPNPLDIEYRGGVMAVGSKAGFATIDPNTGKLKKLIGTAGHKADQFDTVNGLTIGPNGTIYLVDSFNNRLEAFSSNGKRLWSVATGAPSNKVDIRGADYQVKSLQTKIPAKMGLPADICIDGKGRLVVIDAFDFSIAVFNSKNGKFLAKYGEYGSDDGQLSYPSSIAYDPARDWFAIADTGNNRVQIVRIPGSGNPNALSAARRSLAGPLRACLFPLALLLIALLALAVSRNRRKRAARKAALQAQAPAVDAQV